MKSQTREIADHLVASSSTVMRHVTQELAPLTALLLPGAHEATAQAKARNRLQMEALRCVVAQKKEKAKRAREEKAAKKKEEQAAKKQRRT